MSIAKQMVFSFSAAVAGNWYHNITRPDHKVDVENLLQEDSDSLCPIIHWNAIWHHRIATEISAQVFDGLQINSQVLEDYRKNYLRMFSTLPLKSNKSFSYYVGACSLDAVTKKYNKKNLDNLHSITDKLVGDGCFVEGTHYSIYCTDTINRAYSLLEDFYKDDEVWSLIKEKVEALTKWQRLASNKKGIVASIGDSWYEKVEPTTETGLFYYKDMTIHRVGEWVVIQNHRKTGFALHEHPHLDEVLVSKGERWVIQGSGMPSYKHVMASPRKWRRPRNHFFTESTGDYIYFWRLRKKEKINRTVSVGEQSVRIYDSGRKTIRFPIDGDCKFIKKQSSLEWTFNGCNFIVTGEIDNIRECYAHRSIRYREEEKIRVLRISGEKLNTIIS